MSRKSLSSSFGKFIRESIFAKILLFLGRLQVTEKKSRIKDLIKKISTGTDFSKRIIRTVKTAVSKEIEQSVLLHGADLFFNRLLYAQIRVYGMFLFIFSLYTLSIETVKNYIAVGRFSFLPAYVWGGVLLLLSLILLFVQGGKTFAEAVLESRILSFVVFDLLGTEKRRFESPYKTDGGFLVAFLAGTVLSVLTIWIPLPKIVFAVAALIFFRVVFLSPEEGFLTALLILPLVSGAIFQWMLLAVALSLAVKLLRGKRTVKFGFYDGLCLVFSLLLCFAEWIKPVGQRGETLSVMLIPVLGYFLARTLMCHREWAKRATTCLSASALITAIWNIIVYLSDILSEKYGDIFTFLPKIGESMNLADRESSGLLVAVCGPILVAWYVKNGGWKNKMMTVFGGMLLALSTVLSRSPVAWIAFAVGGMFLLVLHRNIHVITVAVFSGLVALLYFFVLPDSVMASVREFSTGFPFSFQEIWEELVECAGRGFFALGLGGADAGGNFYSHLLSELGFIGTLLLGFLILGTWSFALHSCFKSREGKPRFCTALRGYSASLAALVVAGFVYDFMGNIRILSLFFVISGVIFSVGTVLLKENEEQMFATELDRDFIYTTGRKRIRNVGDVFSDGKREGQKTK